MMATASVVAWRLVFGMSGLLVRMSFRVLFKLHPSRDRFVYISGRYNPLFDHAMREDRNRLAMEKIEYPVVPTLQPDTKFIHAVPEVVRFRPAEFVSQILKALDPDATVIQC